MAAMEVSNSDGGHVWATGVIHAMAPTKAANSIDRILTLP
ncbi:hypothetical protein APY04_3547 [Hyphomicrobium sulfonivorans]|uniref:Uncharacterized protein n=1 Tax=Hyphomicrobium sulfonivorans TaxID=121290 RepID=A0A109B8H2_HYPSL|nr:hypothetical protein APY04_3547 [Hyphomicrobium sulfonivorans]